MATIFWRGDAAPVAQVATATITAYDVATTYKVTIGNKVVSTLGTGGTVTTTAAALVALLNASTIPEIAEVTWSNVAGAISGTSDTPGKPFTAVSSVSGGTGTFGAFADTTPSSGPEDWSTAANWSGGAVPVSNDTVYIQNTTGSIKYGLNQSSVSLTALFSDSTFTGALGLPDVNADGDTPYFEYRPRQLQIDLQNFHVGLGKGNGSAMIRVKTGTVVMTANIYNTANNALTDPPPVRIETGVANNTLNHIAGRVGVAFDGATAAKFTTVALGSVSNPNGQAVLEVGNGATIGTVTVDGGELSTLSSVTTLNQYGGQVTLLGTAAITALNGDGGTLYWQAASIIGTPVAATGYTIDATRDPRAKGFGSTLLMHPGSALLDDGKTITFGGPPNVTLVNCDLSEVTLRVGPNRSLTIA